METQTTQYLPAPMKTVKEGREPQTNTQNAAKSLCMELKETEFFLIVFCEFYLLCPWPTFYKTAIRRTAAIG
jgi:hypothetical protein